MPAVAVVAEIRAEFGNAIEFGLDFHGRVAAPMARVLIKELEPYRPLFIEEPVLAEQLVPKTPRRGRAAPEEDDVAPGDDDAEGPAEGGEPRKRRRRRRRKPGGSPPGEGSAG